MKIHILYNFHKSPWGGGNQFLQALRKELKRQGLYTQDPKKAKAIIFNSYPFGAEYFFKKIWELKQKDPNKIIIHRVDGPISFYRGKDRAIDKIIACFAKNFADGIVFQSNWSKRQNKKYFGLFSPYQTVIHNAPDPQIFSQIQRIKFNPQRKAVLVAVSWSKNIHKGFATYQYLDQNLDFDQYVMYFIGNSPIKFKNIKWLKPLVPESLGQILKRSDIFITASRKDPCSNSLIEALACGLPVIARNGGGHPELLENGGELFQGKKDVIAKIEKVRRNYDHYQSQLPQFSLQKTAQEYYTFAKKILKDKEYKPKKIKRIHFYQLKIMALLNHARRRLDP